MTVWKISGEGSTDSAGGELSVYAITSGEAETPEPHKALLQANRLWTWTRIDEVRRVGDIPEAWDQDDQDFTALTRLVAEGMVGEWLNWQREQPEGARPVAS